MKIKIALALLISAALGGLAVQGLHAQAKPPGYAIISIDLTDEAGFVKEYAPMAGKIITGSGGKYLARGGKVVAVEGAPVKRLVVVQFESLDKAVATFTSDAYKEARKVGDKYAKFHILATEGAAP